MSPYPNESLSSTTMENICPPVIVTAAPLPQQHEQRDDIPLGIKRTLGDVVDEAGEDEESSEMTTTSVPMSSMMQTQTFDTSHEPSGDTTLETTTGTGNTNVKLGPFKCDKCEKRFRKLSELKTHIRSHTGEQPFQCHICGKRFTQSSNLGKHIRNLHLNPKANSRSNQRLGSSSSGIHSSGHNNHAIANPRMYNDIQLNESSCAHNSSSSGSSSGSSMMRDGGGSSVSSSNSSSSSSTTNGGTARKDYGYKCFHQGCPATFESNDDLKLHIFETAPSILAEMNVMKANILELTGIVKRWNRSSDAERAGYLHYAQTIERATLDFSIADIAAMNLHSISPAGHGSSDGQQQNAHEPPANISAHGLHQQRFHEPFTRPRPEQEHYQQQQYHHLQQQQQSDSGQGEGEGEGEGEEEWEIDQSVLDINLQEEEEGCYEVLGLKKGRYDISCGWPDLDSAYFGKDNI